MAVDTICFPPRTFKTVFNVHSLESLDLDIWPFHWAVPCSEARSIISCAVSGACRRPQTTENAFIRPEREQTDPYCQQQKCSALTLRRDFDWLTAFAVNQFLVHLGYLRLSAQTKSLRLTRWQLEVQSVVKSSQRESSEAGFSLFFRLL